MRQSVSLWCESAADIAAYSLANKTERALKAFEKAHAWRELFTLAKEQKVEKERVLEMVERVNGEQ